MKLLFYLILVVSCSSCFQSFKMSDKNIRKYYANSSSKPLFAYKDSANSKIHYAYSNDSTKPILLVIHGAPDAWFGYKELFKDSSLLKNYQIIAPDRSGYNKSDDKVTSISQQASLLRSLLKVRNHQKVSILGRSYGAAVAAKLAADNPNLVENLLLIAPACDPQREKFWWFSKPVNTKFIRFLLPKFINRASDEKFAHEAELAKILPDWQLIKCPVTILQGGKDWIIDTANGQFVDSVLVNAPRRYIYLPNNGHRLTAERYDLIRDILLKR